MSVRRDTVAGASARRGLLRYSLAGAGTGAAAGVVLIALLLLGVGSQSKPHRALAKAPTPGHGAQTAARAPGAANLPVGQPAHRAGTASRHTDHRARSAHQPATGVASSTSATGSGAPATSATDGVPPAAGGVPSTPATAGIPAVGEGANGASAAARREIAATEAPDPEASRSFPAPASAHHSVATTPDVAAEAAVAPGAASDAEVRKELQEMQAAENAARQHTFTPVAGGSSIGGNGTIAPPPGIPAVVARVIAGANAIADFPYVFGGGHASFVDNAYDCSGSVSYALAAGGLLSAPETSGQLESWGAPGPGKWITVYANAGHTYMYVDGMLYDTAGRSGVYASRWLVGSTDNSGYVARHWPGL